MPKKSKEINPFDGGWNNFSNPRDIEENELAEAINVDCSVKGQISVRRPIAETNITYTIHSGNGYISGTGFYNFQRDYNLTFSSRADTEIYIIVIKDVPSANQTKVFATNILTSSLDLETPTNAVELIDYNEGANGDPKVTIFNADGNLRISQGNFANNSNSNTQFYGAIEKVSQANNTLTIYNETSNNIIGRPALGTFYAGTMNESGTDTADGGLHLNVNSVKSFTNPWFSWDTGETGYPTSINADDLQYSSPTIAQLESAMASSTLNQNNTSTQLPYNSGFIPTANHETSGTLQHPTDPGNSDIWAITFVGGSSNEKIIIRNDNAIDFANKSIFIDLWIPSEVYNMLAGNMIEVIIGSNAHLDENSITTSQWRYIIPAAEIKEEQWFTYEAVHGSHDLITGNPNSSAIDGLGFDLDLGGNSSTMDSNWMMTMAVGKVELGASSQGQWLGNYKFYYSWIYDYVQHSPTFEFLSQPSTGTEYSGDILQVKTYLEPHPTDGAWVNQEFSPGTSKRITGANIFFAELDNLSEIIDTDKKFLANMDFNEGIRKTLFDNYTLFATNGNNAPVAGRTHATLSFKTPTVLDTFSTVCGYAEGDKLLHVRFGASTVLNNRSYVGNVKIADINGKTFTYPDRVYKSLSGQYDVYTKDNFLEVAPNDGETVTALESYGDFLMEFKETTMYLINVTQDIEYLEETYKFRGVWHENAICKVGDGICWANPYGLFLFDGSEVKNLIQDKIKNSYWSENVLDPTIAFDPIQNEVLVYMKKAGGKAIRYNFDREHVILITNASGTNFTAFTNPITDKEGKIVTIGKTNYDTNGESLHTLRFTGTGTNTITVYTKDHPLDDPARQKSLKKVYVNYKINDGSNLPYIKYTRDNGSAQPFVTADDTSVTNSQLPNTSGSFTTQALKPEVSSNANNGRSFQIRISGTIHTSFVLNDINFIYREKSVK
jgi:hypothetical protein